MRLKDKVAVITGASRGIGRAIALQFAQEGSPVVINYRQQRQAAEAVAAEVWTLGGQALVFGADVVDRAAVCALFAAAEQRFGGVDILVNNAGIGQPKPFPEITDEDWDRLLAVNLKGPFVCCQEIMPYFQKRGGGRIINMASAAGQYHGPHVVHYAVSKAELISLTKAVARHGAPYNVLVNAVAPGMILTDMTRAEMDTAGGQEIINMTLLKRAGELDDVTSTCVYLASPEQNYVTGQVISVSGGAYLG